MIGRVVVFVLGVSATVGMFVAPPAKMFAEPELARILFFHLPCAFWAVLFLFIATGHSLRVLSGKRPGADAKACASMELAGLFCVLTMLTGMVFSKAQWGAWWQGDPRQTSFLIVLFIVGAYFALRMALTDEERRRAFSAAYVLGSLVPNLVLIFVLPRLPQVRSFHPSDTIVGGNLDGMHWAFTLLSFAAIGAAAIGAYRMRLRTADTEQQLENLHGDLENSRDASPAARVVRPVPLHGQGGTED